MKNIVKTWKEMYELKYCFNCYSSLDLAIITNCRQPPKQYVKKFPYFNKQDTRKLILEECEKVSREFINTRVNSMP
ncbi:hypothetical protein K432DRAFT_301623 [Lepidopterella palustris CBS 459.81]|uniref:Uncharacterized protein n=1 Tax=Lepidopterella palustris CBS 459.81 TaxID=1314670 RepID=A0A8E2JDI3_9PEZI|nr:hypothetical protein K432DRAFT_301623 [Lepidopterella palustris CBS 459.81]